MSGHQLSLFDFIDLAIAPGCIPSEFRLQKILHVSLLRVRLAAILDFNARNVRTKVSVKERLFNGSIRYLPQEQEIEYRKRFQLFGLAPAYAWARWDLRRLSSSGWGSDSLPALKPRLGFGLGLGGSSPLLLFGGGLRTAGALLSQGGPLSYSFKTSVGSVPGLRAKGYVDLSVPLPLSFGDDAPGSEAASIDGDRWGGYDTPTGGGYSSYSRRSDSGSGAVRLLLRKTALVLTL